MNRIIKKFKHGSISEGQTEKLLSIYFTAGFPHLEDTVPIVQKLEKAGVDIIEIGLPFSDPLADGPTIQESSTIALGNGMTTDILFEQLESVRKTVDIPLIIMGYFNPVLQYGVEAFCQKCAEIGIDGLILPDLPLEVYQQEYATVFEKYGLAVIFIITPQTSEQRIRKIDEASNAFIYMVSSASTTGAKKGFASEQLDYFDRIARMNLKNPLIVGFGISNQNTFDLATQKAQGAIIGSAFIKHLAQNGTENINTFIQTIRKRI
ncbi:MAG: tryptophan synthase subunit alpha [Flavobacteriaceae bacterium]